MNRPSDLLLTRYVAGEVSAEERTEIDAWLVANPADRTHVARLARYWQVAREGSPRADGAWDTEQEWTRLARHLDLAPGPQRAAEDRPSRPSNGAARRRARPRARPPTSRVATGRRRYRPAAGVGAVLLLALALAYVLVHSIGLPAAREASGSPVTYAAARGERAVVRLADGTTVHLAPDSRLDVDHTFTDGPRRHVRLTGEGYFVVARDTTHPFIVSTERATTRVLGTSFNMSAYPDGRETRVLVVEGSVSVRANGEARRDSVVLSPRQRATLSGQAPGIAVDMVQDVDRHTGWIDGQLAFWDIPFREAVRELERWYDFEGVIADPALMSRPVTALFDGSESLQETLGGLDMALQVRHAREDSARVVFYDATPAATK